jgi:hypothetical protein
MKKVVVFGACARDIRELSRLNISSDTKIVFDPLTAQYTCALEKLFTQASAVQALQYEFNDVLGKLIDSYSSFDGFISSDDFPGITLTSLVAKTCAKNGPSPDVINRLQHKYYARLLQQKIVPQATPACTLVDIKTGILHNQEWKFPCFAKPIKSYFSLNAQKINAHERLLDYLASLNLPSVFYQLFDTLFCEKAYCKSKDNILLEEYLEGVQCTLEGFFYQGTYHFIGIVDSVMYPGTISFEHFVYPSILPPSVQARMSAIAHQCMAGVGFDNGLFNIEFMYNPTHDTIHIIEINPRMAAQFASLYEMVDGFNTYTIALNIALGLTSSLYRKNGKYLQAASCVLRLQEDCEVVQIPSEAEIRALESVFADIRIEVYASKGKRLSAYLQDGSTYRYAVINVGGENSGDIAQKLATCKSKLTFEFKK